MFTDAATLPAPSESMVADVPVDAATAAFTRYCRTRDERDFQEVVRIHLPVVRHICRRILGPSLLLDDAVQETFIKTARHAQTVVGLPGPWIRACAVNAALSLRRSERARRQREQQFAQDQLQVQEPAGETPWEQAIVLTCLAQLGEQDRQVLAEHFLLGRSQTAIAAELGISQVAVHKRIQRALATLRLRVIAAGAADGLRTLAQTHASETQPLAAVADPYTWLLLEVATQRRRRLWEALLHPVRACVEAAVLALEQAPTYYSSSARYGRAERVLRWSVQALRAAVHWVDPRTWMRPRIS